MILCESDSAALKQSRKCFCSFSQIWLPTLSPLIYLPKKETKHTINNVKDDIPPFSDLINHNKLFINWH